MTDIVEIVLSRDSFECRLLTEAVRSRGYQVELVMNRADMGQGLPSQPGLLLVHVDDVDSVRNIIASSHPIDPAGQVSKTNRRISSGSKKIFQIVLAIYVLAMLLLLVRPLIGLVW